MIFSDMCEFTCEVDEEIASLETLVLGKQTFFCVGTWYYQPKENEPSRGRVLIFQTRSPSHNELELDLAASMKVQGCVYGLAAINGLLAATVNSAVLLLRLRAADEEKSEHGTHVLENLVEKKHNYVATNLVSHGSTLILGDSLSSVSILKLNRTRAEEGGATAERRQLVQVTRDYSPLWPTAVQANGDGGIIGA
jgi:DNA damage-binding protein 1